MNGIPLQVRYRPVLYTMIDDNGNVWFDYRTTQNIGGVARLDSQGKAMV